MLNWFIFSLMFFISTLIISLWFVIYLRSWSKQINEITIDQINKAETNVINRQTKST